jgi:hypothetical protein
VIRLRRVRGGLPVGGVSAAYARHLRARLEGRPSWMWGPYVRRGADLESGRPVAVRYWEVRRFCPYLRLDAYDWVEIRGDDVVPVDPVYSGDALRIVGFLPVGGADAVAANPMTIKRIP